MSPTTPAPDRLADCMRRHDHQAPDGGVVAARVVRGLADRPSPGRSGRPGPAGLTAALAVVGVVMVAVAVGRGGGPPEAAPAPTPASTARSQATSQATAATGAVLDPLTIRLLAGRPRSDGSLPVRIHVENDSGRPVIDPGCRVAANLSFGVIPVDRPDAPLRWQSRTSCTGPQVLPPGYDETFRGMVVSVRGLPPGRYLVAVDYGAARSERVFAPVRVTRD